MKITTPAVFAVFKNPMDISSSVEYLEKFGVNCRSQRIYRLLYGGGQDFSQIKGRQIYAGAIAGSIVGLLLMLLLGLFFDFEALQEASLSKQSLNLWPIYLGLFGGAILVGIFAGILVGAGISNTTAKRYGQYLKTGGIMMSLRAQPGKQYEMIKRTLNSFGAYDVQLEDESSTWQTALAESRKFGIADTI